MIKYFKSSCLFLQKHFVFSLTVIIILCMVINWFIFAYDNNENPHFHRNHIVVNENEKDIKKYLSSPFTDATHFTLTTFSTVGYGDISPLSSPAKAWTNFMQFLVIVMTLKLFEYVSSNNSSCQADFKEFMLAKQTAEKWKEKTRVTPIGPTVPK